MKSILGNLEQLLFQQAKPSRGFDSRGITLADTPGAGISNDRELNQHMMRRWGGAVAPGAFDGIYGGPLLRAVYERHGEEGLREALMELLRRDTNDSAKEVEFMQSRRIGM